MTLPENGRVDNSIKIDTSSGVVFLDAATIDCDDIDFSSLENVALPLTCFSNTTEEELAGRNLDAWCVIVNKVKLNRTFFAMRPNLRLVCVIATGVNNVDLEAARDYNVTVMNCRGYSTETVAQHTVMLMLILLRNFTPYQADIAVGAWQNSSSFCLLDYPIQETTGLKLGVVGFGEIGQRLSQLVTAFGVEVFVAERPGVQPRSGRFSFDEILQTCDIISLHCPLTPETHHIIDRRALRLMRRNTILINTARGGLIDETALLEALTNGWITGAALDVLEEEPPSIDHPLMRAALPNLIFTPHNAWGSRHARQRAVDQTTENIKSWLCNNDTY